MSQDSLEKRTEVAMSERHLKSLKKYRDALLRKYGFLSVIAFFILLASAIGVFVHEKAIIPGAIMLILMRILWERMQAAKYVYKLEEEEGVMLCHRSKILELKMQDTKPYECWVTTEIGKFKISTQLFSVLKMGEEALVFVGKHSGWLIEIKTMATEEFWS